MNDTEVVLLAPPTIPIHTRETEIAVGGKLEKRGSIRENDLVEMNLAWDILNTSTQHI